MQNLTPLSRPLYIEIEEGQPSPFFKQLLSKVGSSQVQFLDFTLQGNVEQDFQEFEGEQQGKVQKQMSIIEEQEQQIEASIIQKSQKNDKKLVTSQFEYNPEEYIPNMHLLDIGPSLLKMEHFKQTLTIYNSAPVEEKKQFIFLYLTDQDLEAYKDAGVEDLTKVVYHNLSLIGNISRLERKAKVSRYLQKKKKRIWRKKINYDCRKKVADNRLRVKGKFVTSEQACTMLGIEHCSQQQLKQILKNNYNKLML